MAIYKQFYLPRYSVSESNWFSRGSIRSPIKPKILSCPGVEIEQSAFPPPVL